jgi:hypothetical protein
MSAGVCRSRIDKKPQENLKSWPPQSIMLPFEPADPCRDIYRQPRHTTQLMQHRCSAHKHVYFSGDISKMVVRSAQSIAASNASMQEASVSVMIVPKPITSVCCLRWHDSYACTRVNKYKACALPCSKAALPDVVFFLCVRLRVHAMVARSVDRLCALAASRAPFSRPDARLH